MAIIYVDDIGNEQFIGGIKGLKLQWTNPSPSNTFPINGQINLKDNDYDYLIFVFKEVNTNSRILPSCFVPKGFPIMTCYGADYGVSGVYYVGNYVRRWVRVNDTQFTSEQCFVKYNGSNTANTDGYLIPMFVYSGKF